tara:strand:+ start:2911 stop:3039 length:129 start_codon:yes stop_codon:yes gene_type:complete
MTEPGAIFRLFDKKPEETGKFPNPARYDNSSPTTTPVINSES